MKTLNQSQTKSTGAGKPGRARGPVQRDAKEEWPNWIMATKIRSRLREPFCVGLPPLR